MDTNHSLQDSNNFGNNTSASTMPDEANDESLVFIFVPLSVLGIILILAALVRSYRRFMATTME
jgi:hypothetical protein